MRLSLNILEFVSGNLVNVKRPHELTILQFLMRLGEFRKKEVKKAIIDEYKIEEISESLDSAINVLCGGLNMQIWKYLLKRLDIIQG